MADKNPSGEVSQPAPQPSASEVSKAYLRNWEIESGANRLVGVPVTPVARKD